MYLSSGAARAHREPVGQGCCASQGAQVPPPDADERPLFSGSALQIIPEGQSDVALQPVAMQTFHDAAQVISPVAAGGQSPTRLHLAAHCPPKHVSPVEHPAFGARSFPAHHVYAVVFLH